MNMHPSDVIYALDRAIFHSTAAGEESNVIADLRQMRDEVQRAARAGKQTPGLKLPNPSTGD